MKSIMTLMMLTMFLLTTTGVSANYGEGENKRNTGEKHETLPNVDEDTQAAITALHEAMRADMETLKADRSEEMTDAEKEAMKEKVTALRDAYHAQIVELLGDNEEAVAALEERKTAMQAKQAEMAAEKELMKAAKEELLSQLDDDTRAALEALHTDHKAATAALKESRSEDMTDAEKEAMRTDWEALRTSHEAEVSSLLADYPEVLAAMTVKKESSKKMGKKKGEKTGERTGDKVRGEKAEGEYMDKENKGKSSDRAVKRGMYKKQFSAKYQSRLERLSTENLDMILEKIAEHTVKIEANTGLSDEKRETVLAQLEALTEMIVEMK